MKNLVKTSKYISKILRHQPELIGLKLDSHGWGRVDCLLKGVDISFQELELIVANDEKQRYSFNEDRTLIRANQGHSVAIDLGLEPVQPPNFLYHGTVGKYVASIRKLGLQKQGRQYVHLSHDIATAVKVGQRRGKPVILLVYAGQMYTDGYQFYCSENGVWLTDEVPPQYLK